MIMAITGILSNATVMLVDIYIHLAKKSVTPASGGGNAFVCAAICAGFAERVKAGAQVLLLLEYSCRKTALQSEI